MPRAHTDSHRLLDAVKVYLDLERDLELAQALKVQPSCISKIRRGTNKISALVLLRIHLVTDVPIQELIKYCRKDEFDFKV
jgi:plasmid maintenance system antidote protein VapI